MRTLFSKKMIWLCLTAALLIFSIRFFETGFNSGQVSAKIYITIIGIIFLIVGAFTAAQMIKRKTVVQYIDREKEPLVQANGLLTDRESQILQAIAKGLTNKQIGEQLFVSENTVKKHINNIYFKLDVNRRTQAVARAKELRILSQ